MAAVPGQGWLLTAGSETASTEEQIALVSGRNRCLLGNYVPAWQCRVQNRPGDRCAGLTKTFVNGAQTHSFQ